MPARPEGPESRPAPTPIPTRAMRSARGAERSPTHAGEPSGPVPAAKRARLRPWGVHLSYLSMSHRRLRRSVRTSPVLDRSLSQPVCAPASRMLPPRTAPVGRSDRDRFKGTFGVQAWPNSPPLPPIPPAPHLTTPSPLHDSCQLDPVRHPRSLPRVKGGIAALRNAHRADIVKLQVKEFELLYQPTLSSA